MSIPAVAYLRTSSQTNIGSGKDSEQRQRSACLEFAKKNDYLIKQYFYDADVSGSISVLNRPGFIRLLEYCANESIKYILFENASRFSRSLLEQELGHRQLTGRGLTLLSVESPATFLGLDPTSMFIRQVLGAVSEFEKNILVSKLRGSRERKKRINYSLGIVTLSGHGKCEGRKSILEGLPDAVVREISLMNQSGYSLREISRWLNNKGYNTQLDIPYSATQITRLL